MARSASATSLQNTFTSNLIVDENIQDTDDLRFNWQNGLAVAMNQRLALKVGVGLAYDNQPQLVEVALLSVNGIELRPGAGPRQGAGRRGDGLDRHQLPAGTAHAVAFAPHDQRRTPGPGAARAGPLRS